MRKSILFFIGLILAGTLSFYVGYYLYVTNRPKISYEMPMVLQKGMLQNEEIIFEEKTISYLAKIENDKLIIYEMPEERVYDTVNIGTLQLAEEDYDHLTDGMSFHSLGEVFEFLENCMS